MSTLAATQLQNGVVVVGPKSGSNLATASVTFPQPFATPPVVTANTLQGTDYAGKTITDTFAVSITSVSTTGFKANIFRVDNIPNGQGWGQNLQLGWTAYSG